MRRLTFFCVHIPCHFKPEKAMPLSFSKETKQLSSWPIKEAHEKEERNWKDSDIFVIVWSDACHM